MTGFEKEEFWKALGRLYDASVELHRSCELLVKESQSHEKRLDKIEVVQQWLAEKERRRENEQGG